MTLELTTDLLNQIHAHGEEAYPEEGAGFLLGRITLTPDPSPLSGGGESLTPEPTPLLGGGETLTPDPSPLSGGGERDYASRRVAAILRLPNAREDAARHNRYLITPQDYLRAEEEAERLGLDVLGVFHSHPDHPNRPSEFDREWAMPWFSYLITSVNAGHAVESRAWRLAEDRGKFEEESIFIESGESKVENSNYSPFSAL